MFVIKLINETESLIEIKNWIESDGSYATDKIAVASLDEDGILSDNQIYLYQNIPNPFTNETMIQFYLPEACEASLEVYNLLN